MIELTIEKIVYGGDGLARTESGTVFVPLTAPGDRVRAEIIEQRKGFARAALESVLEPSPVRREPPCKFYGRCGGCQLQHLTYEAQLRAKSEFIRESLSRLGQIDWTEPVEIIAGAEFEYRSRLRLQVDRQHTPPRVGFFEAKSHRVCDVDECKLAAPEVNAALKSFRDSVETVSSDREIEILASSGGQVETVRYPESPSTRVLQTVGENAFEYDARSFFQVNRFLVERLASLVCGGEEGKLALDLYGGVGLLSVPLAARFDRVVCVESSAHSCRLARQNVTLAGLRNVECVSAEVAGWLARQSEESVKASLVVLDPPRAGAGKQVIRELARLRPARITYVSCDPTTLARDLKALVASNYKIASVTGLDLFPQTTHVETVVKLTAS